MWEQFHVIASHSEAISLLVKYAPLFLQGTWLWMSFYVSKGNGKGKLIFLIATGELFIIG
jgi:hypothetical protein